MPKYPDWMQKALLNAKMGQGDPDDAVKILHWLSTEPQISASKFSELVPKLLSPYDYTGRVPLDKTGLFRLPEEAQSSINEFHLNRIPEEAKNYLTYVSGPKDSLWQVAGSIDEPNQSEMANTAASRLMRKMGINAPLSFRASFGPFQGTATPISKEYTPWREHVATAEKWDPFVPQGAYNRAGLIDFFGMPIDKESLLRSPGGHSKVSALSRIYNTTRAFPYKGQEGTGQFTPESLWMSLAGHTGRFPTRENYIKAGNYVLDKFHPDKNKEGFQALMKSILGLGNIQTGLNRKPEGIVSANQVAQDYHDKLRTAERWMDKVRRGEYWNMDPYYSKQNIRKHPGMVQDTRNFLEYGGDLHGVVPEEYRNQYNKTLGVDVLSPISMAMDPPKNLEEFLRMLVPTPTGVVGMAAQTIKDAQLPEEEKSRLANMGLEKMARNITNDPWDPGQGNRWGPRAMEMFAPKEQTGLKKDFRWYPEKSSLDQGGWFGAPRGEYAPETI